MGVFWGKILGFLANFERYFSSGNGGSRLQIDLDHAVSSRDQCSSFYFNLSVEFAHRWMHRVDIKSHATYFYSNRNYTSPAIKYKEGAQSIMKPTMWVFGSNFVKLYLLILACSRQVQPFSLSSDAIGNFRESFVLSMSSSEKSRSDSRSKEYRSLKPLPCLGSYEQDMGTKYSSMFLGFEKMVVQERADGKCVCKGTSMPGNEYTRLQLPLHVINATNGI